MTILAFDLIIICTALILAPPPFDPFSLMFFVEEVKKQKKGLAASCLPPIGIPTMVLDVLSCPFVPFCDFQDSDTEIMMQHVYLVHSESTDGSDGPDRPSDYNGRGQQSDGGSGSGESWEGATSASVTDAMSDFIDCHCGEYCLLAEFDDHLEMHNAEGMVFGDNEKVMTLTRLDVHHGDASTSDSKKHPEDPPQHSNASSKLVPFARLMVGHRRSDDLEHEGHNSVSDVRTEAVISRKSRTFSQHKKKAMRLGVSIRSLIFYLVIPVHPDFPGRAQSWALLLMNRRCPDGCVRYWKKGRKSPW